MKVVLKFLSIVAVCFLLGFGVWRLADLGYFQQWKRVTPAPEDAAQYLAASTDPSSQHPVKFIKPCDYSQPEFTFTAHPPAGIVDCLQRSDLYPDGYGRTTYVLDSAGNVWIWGYTLLAYTTLSRMICWPAAGLVVGVIIALVVKTS